MGTTTETFTTTLGETTSTASTTTAASSAPEELYTAWSEWSKCRAKCGKGFQSRTKICLNMDLCELPILSEDQECYAGVCDTDLSALELYLTESDVLIAMRAIEEDNLHLLQLVLYNNDINVMMYQMLTRRGSEPTIRKLLDDFIKVKSIYKPVVPTLAPAKMIEPPVILKSAVKPKPVAAKPPSISKIEADYVIGRLVQDHLSNQSKSYPKK